MLVCCLNLETEQSDSCWAFCHERPLTARLFCWNFKSFYQKVSPMPQVQKISLVRRLSQAGTLLHTWLHGIKIGSDSFGNSYYRSKASAGRERRWVIYAGEPEASTVPPEWHGWLHHTLSAPLPGDGASHKAWQKPHQENLTGTPAAYFPPGHVLKGGQRAQSTSDYQAWKPE